MARGYLPLKYVRNTEKRRTGDFKVILVF